MFIAPGSTVNERRKKKYRFKTVLGVGCLMEIREGLEMMDGYGVPARGVVRLGDGCVETAVNWVEVNEVTSPGVVGRSGRSDVELPARSRVL